MKMKEREISFDIMRIIAIIGVFYNHKDCYNYFMTVPFDDIRFYICMVLSFFAKTGAPLFLCISGACLLSKNEDLKIIYTKRIPRMILALGLICLSMRFFGMSESVRDAFLHDSNWYLFAYIAFLICLPFLRKLMEVEDIYKKYFLIIVIITNVAMAIQKPFGIEAQFLNYFQLFANDVASFSWNLIFPLAGAYIYDYIMKNRKHIYIYIYIYAFS